MALAVLLPVVVVVVVVEAGGANSFAVFGLLLQAMLLSPVWRKAAEPEEVEGAAGAGVVVKPWQAEVLD